MVKYNSKQLIRDVKCSYNDSQTFDDFIKSVEYSSYVVVDRFGSWDELKYQAGCETNSVECPSCNTHYSYISNHWNSCGEPGLSQKQKSLLVGMLLSDGTVNNDGAFTTYSSNKKFIDWFSDELGFMSYPPVLHDLGEERHQRNIESGFDVNRDSDYKDMYAASSPVHSFTKSLRKWYECGEKEIPQDLTIDETALKIWYCGDGGLKWSGDNGYAQIRPLSFSNNSVRSLLDNFSINYSIQTDGTVCFYSDSQKFLDIIGKPPEGMEYKWKINNRERYNEMVSNIK